MRGFRGPCVQLEAQGTIAHHNTVTAGFTGIKIGSADVDVKDNLIFNQRDYGIDVISGAGSSLICGNRIYGCNNGGPDGGGVATDGAACRVLGPGGFRSIGNQFADSFYGLIADSQFGSYTGDYVYQNFKRDIDINGTGNTFVNYLVRVMGSTTQYPDKYGVVMNGARTQFLGGRIESDSHQPAHVSGFTGAILVWIGADNCKLSDTFLVDGDSYTNTKAIVMQGSPVRGTRINVVIEGTRFEGANERLLDADLAHLRNIDATFIGNFTDSLMDDNQNTVNETAGMKKFSHLIAGWTGTIRVIDTSADTGSPPGAGTTITLQEGLAY